MREIESGEKRERKKARTNRDMITGKVRRKERERERKRVGKRDNKRNR